MPNISTSNTNAIYKYTAQISATFPGDSEVTVIEDLRFKYVIVDYNYDEFNFPLIYCMLSLTIDQRNKLVTNQKNATIVFTLQKYIENSDMPGLKIDVINEECIYFISTDTNKLAEKDKVLDENRSEDLSDSITIGLISLNHINRNKKVVNGIIKSGTMSSTLCYVLNGHTLLMEPIQNNITMSNFALPPINSVSKMIKYLDSYKTFYSTPYRFFMDFDVTYLISSSGKGVLKRGDKINDIKINIIGDYQESNMEGMYTDPDTGIYVLDCSGSYTVLNTTTDSSKSFSTIGGVTADGTMVTVDTGLNESDSPIVKKTNLVRVPNNNTSLISNMAISTANNAVTMSIAKNKIDSSILTPNRHYTVDVGSVYEEKYTGDYLLARRRDLYLHEGEGLALGAVLYMKKVSSST